MLGLNVIASASRPETEKFVREMGADHVINHRKSLKDELERIGIKEVDYSFHCWELTSDYLGQLAAITRPLGLIGCLTSTEPVDIRPMIAKS